MPDEGKVCVCPQCGKKYKLKEGFEAKSFSCKGCGATVWVAGKPPAPAPTATKGAAAAPAVVRKGGRGGRATGSRGGGGRHRAHGRGEREEGEGKEGRRGHGREKPKSKATLWLAVAGVAVVGIVIVIAVISGKDKGKGKAEGQQVAQQPAGTNPVPGPGLAAAGTPPGEQPATNPAGANPTPGVENPKNPAPGETAKGNEGETEAPVSPEGGETTKKPVKGLGGADVKKGMGQYDPPASLGHLETTTPEMRKQIDELIAVMFDVQAGKDSNEAKAKLAAIGKPAFLPILGKMAAIRDTITDSDTVEERLIESSLMLADLCLREMDGYLDANDKAPIRPGTDKEYITYILRLHYRRWTDGMKKSTPLKDLDQMPGAFDPSTAKSGDDDEEPAPGGKGK